MPFAGKPILGIVGGIASGKSFVSKSLALLGCKVIDSDALAHEIYRQPEIIRTLTQWYGPGVIDASGQIDRRAVGSIVFRDPAQRKRLEALLHPLIDQRRVQVMAEAAGDPALRAFVWDSPLLIEAGLHRDCDALLFVDTPIEIRQARVAASRGWSAQELDRRERAQLSLDEKRRLAKLVVDGTLDAAAMRDALEPFLIRLALNVSTIRLNDKNGR